MHRHADAHATVVRRTVGEADDTLAIQIDAVSEDDGRHVGDRCRDIERFEIPKTRHGGACGTDAAIHTDRAARPMPPDEASRKDAAVGGIDHDIGIAIFRPHMIGRVHGHDAAAARSKNLCLKVSRHVERQPRRQASA